MLKYGKYNLFYYKLLKLDVYKEISVTDMNKGGYSKRSDLSCVRIFQVLGSSISLMVQQHFHKLNHANVK